MRLKDPHQLDSAITILAHQSMLVGNTTSSGRDANGARGCLADLVGAD